MFDGGEKTMSCFFKSKYRLKKILKVEHVPPTYLPERRCPPSRPLRSRLVPRFVRSWARRGARGMEGVDQGVVAVHVLQVALITWRPEPALAQSP